MFRRIAEARNANTWSGRFWQVLLYTGVPAFLMCLIVGWARGWPLTKTMVDLWLWVFVICLVIAIGQASLRKGDESFWRLPR